MSIVTYPLNGVTYSAEDVGTYLCTRTSGVYSKETNFAVSITGTRELTVSPGLAWINYDDFAGVSVCSRESTVLTVPSADSILSRIDRVVLQFDADANLTVLKIKSGTPAVDPQPPAMIQTHRQYELGLCTVSVPAGSTAVTVADIYDTRADETVCGVMRDGVTGIPAATLIQLLRQKIAEVDSGNFYTKEAVDAMLAEIQAQLKKDISAASAIAESGAGYIRYSDGTQICYGATSTVNLDKWTAVNRFTFPVPFIDTNYCVSITQPSDPDLSNYVSGAAAAYCHTYRPTSNLICIGRWK